ncbi:MAG: hypothetical protein EAX86_10285 [Candidatus Heimdallarchaeota archaeon]|nr:hypothetical protein [Candidatus Heimdallarchaeota archaeon]
MGDEKLILLSDEEIKEIADRAAQNTMKNLEKHKTQARKSNRRNGLLALALGMIIIIGGVLLLNAGVGVYLLMSGVMLL